MKKQAAFATCASAADVAKVLETYNTDNTKANAFAKTVAAHVTDMKTTGTGKVNLPAAGYYLIVDTTATTGTYDAKNLSLLKVNGAGEVTPTKKTDKPTLEKKVKVSTILRERRQAGRILQTMISEIRSHTN